MVEGLGEVVSEDSFDVVLDRLVSIVPIQVLGCVVRFACENMFTIVELCVYLKV